MVTKQSQSVLHFILAISFAAPALSESPASSWLSFRGDGSSSAATAPKSFSTDPDGNLAWQVDMPGRGVGSPIVVGDVVVTTSSSDPDEEDLFVTAIELQSGEVRWQQKFRATGRPFHHPTSANAAPSPVSDGKNVVAFFSSNDLVCLSTEGDLLWYRGLGADYPSAGNDVGMASSPVIADGAVIVQVESQGDSFAAAIELASGKNRWRISRPALSNWSSPLVIDNPNSEQAAVIMQSREDVVAVDPANGTELWRIDEARGAIPSASQGSGILLLPGDDLMAIQTDKIPTGAANTPTALWRENKLSPRNATVAIAGDRLYSLKGSVLVAASVAEGETAWQQRLSGLGGTWATPVIADSHIYIFDQSGVGLILHDKGDSAETVGQVELGDGVLGTPAIASGRLVVRSVNKLFCFE